MVINIFLNISVDLPNEFSNGIKLLLKIDQWVMRSILLVKKNQGLLTCIGRESFKTNCWKFFVGRSE